MSMLASDETRGPAAWFSGKLPPRKSWGLFDLQEAGTKNFAGLTLGDGARVRVIPGIVFWKQR